MKRLNNLPDDFFISKSEHEKAILNMTKNSNYVTIPIHTANILVDGTPEPYIIKTIIPPVYVYFSLTTKGLINRQSLQYKITYSGQAFPLAHVYSSSGALCLGDIFVPATLKTTDIMLPLETLFLHNDRNVHHGAPSLPNNFIPEVSEYLKSIGIHDVFPESAKDWILDDSLWKLGNILLNNFDKQTAFQHATIIFKKIFT